MHRVGAKNVGQVGPVGLVGRLAQDACESCALKIPERMALTAPCAPVRQVRQVRQVRHSLPAVSALRNVLCQPTEHTALCYRNSKAHGTQAAIDHLQYSRYSQYSWFLCSHPVPCAKCFASQRECAMFFGGRTAHGARGETLLFPPCTPFSPVCCKKACGTQCGFFTIRGARPIAFGGGAA